ncbi:LysR substrate-binding domain-containing protein [Paraglaciecola arctica]|uniref:LysR substrate-binding domain-containing protein n=1 Tax=Paraglaciecola arctica TaxID=1128911 RepID=UPI001C07A779|nr:LysR substrate-binding domain-containing protein [Paraglaciecola arctica]MBU3004401.1 LysR family transcriptional regulator [Paraglaciecola arctica]
MDRRLRHIALLRCFDAAARHQSYSLAAQELSITQAAVSQQIRNLEESLKVKLFVRESRAMRLTKQGKILANAVSKAFEELSLGFDRIQVEPQAGVLTVTASPSFCSRWLVPRLWKLSALYPDIQVRAVASAQYEDVRHSDIDVAIRQGEMQDKNVHQEVLIQDPVFPVCSPKVYQEQKLDHPEKINQCWLVEAIGAGRWGFSWKDWFNLAGVPLDPQGNNWMEVTTWEMGINAVLSGHGIFLTSGCMAQDLIESGALIKPFEIQIEPGLKFSLLFDEESPRVARINVFTEWLKTELQA